MMRVLQWIWGQIKHLVGLVAGLASSLLTWIAAAVTAFFVWANSLLDAVFQNALQWLQNEIPSLEWGSAVDFSGVVGYLCGFFALDTLVEGGFTLLGLWVAARLARLAMVPIRAALDLL